MVIDDMMTRFEGHMIKCFYALNWKLWTHGDTGTLIIDDMLTRWHEDTRTRRQEKKRTRGRVDNRTQWQQVTKWWLQISRFAEGLFIISLSSLPEGLAKRWQMMTWGRGDILKSWYVDRITGFQDHMIRGKFFGNFFGGSFLNLPYLSCRTAFCQKT